MLGFQVSAKVSFVSLFFVRCSHEIWTNCLSRLYLIAHMPTCFICLSWWDYLGLSSDHRAGEGAALSLGNEEPGETGKKYF